MTTPIQRPDIWQICWNCQTPIKGERWYFCDNCDCSWTMPAPHMKDTELETAYDREFAKTSPCP